MNYVREHRIAAVLLVAALAASPAMGQVIQESEYEPNRTYQVRTGQFNEAPISVYFTVRQFWGKQPFKTFAESYQNQRRVLDELVTQYVIPNVITPLQKVIGAKQ